MNDFGFLLLCGGHSRRMGQNKALLTVEGMTLLQRIARVGDSFSECIISANEEIPTPPNFNRVADIYPECGPMGGLHAALSVCKAPALVCTPCDVPYYNDELAKFLIQKFSSDLDALILQGNDGRIHPLMGVYSKSCLPVLTEHLQNGKLKLIWMLDGLNTRIIRLPPEISQNVFINLNTKQEYEKFCSEILNL